MVDTSSPLESLRSVVGLKQGGEDVMAGLGALQAMGVVGSAAAAWLRTVEDATSRMQRPDLVWSGPKVPGVHARDTRQVYEELLGSAERSIWASSYAYFDGPKAFHVLASRMDERPELRVTLLLNIQRKKGDTTAPDELVRGFADRFWEKDWPGSVRPMIYYDPRTLEPDGPSGVLHAKAVVADGPVGLRHVREPHRGGARPQYRARAAATRPRARVKRVGSLSRSDRRGITSPVADGMK